MLKSKRKALPLHAENERRQLSMSHTTKIGQPNISERRTAFVVVFTFFVMIAELTVGILSHSMALTADGVHMGSHVLVLGLNWAAYILVRRLERRKSDQYNSQRILSLSAWTSGIFLLVMAIFIVVEAIERLTGPHVEISSMQAFIVAGIGLVANIICASALHGHHDDLNSHAAYLHIVSDVLTEIGVIIGLICATLWNITYIDTVVALIAAVIVIRWAINLLRTTAIALVKNQS